MANPIKAIKAVKKITKGKEKVNRRVGILDTIAEHRSGGNLGYVYKKRKMIEVFDNHPPIKVKPRNIGKVTKRMAPDSKKTTKQLNKIIKKDGMAIKPNAKVNPRYAPKVPVKRRSK